MGQFILKSETFQNIFRKMVGIYVDGACNKSIGSCCSVTDINGNDMIEPYKEFLSHFEFLQGFQTKIHNCRTVYVINFSDVSQQQNNGCELVAFCIGLLIATYYKYDVVYSDSDLLVKYWSKKNYTTIKDPFKSKIQRYCVELRQNYENMGGSVEKISGDDNPADLGFHKKKC